MKNISRYQKESPWAMVHSPWQSRRPTEKARSFSCKISFTGKKWPLVRFYQSFIRKYFIKPLILGTFNMQ